MRSKLLVTFLFLLSLICISSVKAYDFFDPEAEFLDFDHLIEIFGRPNKEAVYIINDTECPVEITDAEIADRGTIKFPQLHDALSTFQTKVRNKTDKRVLSYQLTWSVRHPFEKYVIYKVLTNSVNVMKPHATQKLKFTRDKYFREDAYYEVMISKVVFDDQTIWEAPEDQQILTKDEEIKKEIELMNGTTDVDRMTKQELLDKFGVGKDTKVTPPGAGTTTQSDSYQGL